MRKLVPMLYSYFVRFHDRNVDQFDSSVLRAGFSLLPHLRPRFTSEAFLLL